MTIQLVESKITKSKPFHSIIKTTNLKSTKSSSSKTKSKSKSKSTQTLTIIDNGLELYQNNTSNNSNQQQQPKLKSKYNKSMIKISNPGPFTSIQPESTLIGINQKSIRGMSLVQVSQILERVPIGHDLILLARCEKDDDDIIHGDHDHDIIHDDHDPRNKRKDHDKNDKDNSNFSTRTLTEREKNRIATGGTKYSHCCIPCGGGGCEGCGECCLCRIQ